MTELLDRFYGRLASVSGALAWRWFGSHPVSVAALGGKAATAELDSMRSFYRPYYIAFYGELKLGERVHLPIAADGFRVDRALRERRKRLTDTVVLGGHVTLGDVVNGLVSELPAFLNRNAAFNRAGLMQNGEDFAICNRGGASYETGL